MLNRRRMLMSVKPKENWNIDWNYTQGDLTEFGFTKDGTTQMTDKGLLMYGYGSFSRCTAPQVTAKKSIAEIVFNIKEMPTSNGLRLMLSNGTVGNHLYLNNNNIDYEQQGVLTRIGTCEVNRDYLIRQEFDEKGTNKIYLDGKLIYQTDQLSSQFVKKNSIMQQINGETYIKELRYKFIEV